MKDSREYSKKLKKLYRQMKQRAGKVEKVSYEEPVDALIYAIVSEHLTEQQTSAAMRRLGECFVDRNDLRVALPEEIVEALDEDISVSRQTAARLKNVLGAVFDKYNAITLESLRKPAFGKRPARQVLEKLPAISPFVVDYCMLTALSGHAVPLTPRTMEYLAAGGIVHPQSDYETVEGFLTRQFSVDNAYEVYVMLRRASETAAPEKKRSRKS